jgi:hypothetical protein
MTMLPTSLLIKTTVPHPTGTLYVWSKLQDPRTTFRNIATPAMSLDDPDAVARLVTGVPTPFARARMFMDAMAMPENQPHAGGLLSYYAALRKEWKGLITALALDGREFTVDRITLAPTAGDANLFEPRGAIGRMLFEEKGKWKDQTSGAAPEPYVQLLKYRGRVVGATHPDCLLFTAAAYRLPGEGQRFLDRDTGRFTEAERGLLSPDELRKLVLYLKHIQSELLSYENQFSVENRPRINPISNILDTWRSSLQDEAESRGIRVREGDVKPTVTQFQHPFDVLLNIRNTLYGANGRLYGNLEEAQSKIGEGAGVVEVELGELLLDPASTTLVELVPNSAQEVSRLGSHMLRVSDAGRTRLFALPLSEKALRIFETGLVELLNPDGTSGSRLRAQYDSSRGVLNVEFDVELFSGGRSSIQRSYADTLAVQGKRVVCWPDFVSEDWHQYYLYSELPHSMPEISAFPIRADKKQFKFKIDGSDRLPRLFEGNADLRAGNKDDGCSLLVEYNEQALGSSRDIQYEIYQSNEPFKGIQLIVRNQAGGYIVFRELGAVEGLVAKQHLGNLKDMTIGVDFGSNNSCVSFIADADTLDANEPKLVQFRNRRRFLFGVESERDFSAPIIPSEVFFFQAEHTVGNQIKSMVMTHDDQRIVGLAKSADNREKLVKAGFPVFGRNIPVESAEESKLLVRMGSQPSTIRYNMKWGHDAAEQAHKVGFLRMLLLQTTAELYAEHAARPKRVAWAYPSAMTTHHQNEYQALWMRVVGMESPLRRETSFAQAATLRENADGTDNLSALTEAEAVCRFAQQSVQVAQDSIFIGFDVGGSTTDILCMVNGLRDNKKKLIREGSIRIAAGILADATRKSSAFQEVIRSYCHSQDINLVGVTIPPNRLNDSTAPYYFNALLDRLTEQAQLQELYRSIGRDCKELVALNAFMTGLVMYHAGQIAAAVRAEQVRNEDELGSPFTQITIGCYGKGGRMFDWLSAILGRPKADRFYADCFRAGCGTGVAENVRTVTIKPADGDFVKAEVSFGLASKHHIELVLGALKDPIGEDGVTYRGEPLTAGAPILPEHLEHLGGQFMIDLALPQLRAFVTQFVQFMGTNFNLQLHMLVDQIAEMGVIAYIQNMPEYQRSKGRANAFDFKAPLFVLEGMCFMDKVLRPKLKL